MFKVRKSVTFPLYLAKSYLCRLKNIDDDKIFLVGPQKSGTTAIAALLARATNQKPTLDFSVRQYVYRDFWNAVDGELLFSDFVAKHACEFSGRIVKEPNLSLVVSEVRRSFPGSRMLAIVRHPLDTIRSVCNRLGCNPSASIQKCRYMTPVWKQILSRQSGSSVAVAYAEHWSECVQCICDDGIPAWSYERFLDDKMRFIQRMAEDLDLPCGSMGLAQRQMDVQYQPTGVPVADFSEYFGDVYDLVRTVVSHQAGRLGYGV